MNKQLEKLEIIEETKEERSMPWLVPSSRSSITESCSSDYMLAKTSVPSQTDSEQSLLEIAEEKEIDDIEMNKSTTLEIGIVADDSEAGKDDKSMAVLSFLHFELRHTRL